MAFEDIIKAHTEALNSHTAALEKFVKASGGAAASAKAADKPAASKPAASAAKKNEKPLVDQIAEAAGAYLKAGDADDRKAAATNIKKIVVHYGADRLTGIDEEHHADVLAHVKAFAAGEEPELGDGDGEGSII